MDYITFPSAYKSSLVSGKKTCTIRILDEVGNYKVSNVYKAKTYRGKDWKIKIKITEIISTTLGRLHNLGIPERTVRVIINNHRISLTEKADLIRFKLIH